MRSITSTKTTQPWRSQPPPVTWWRRDAEGDICVQQVREGQIIGPKGLKKGRRDVLEQGSGEVAEESPIRQGLL